MAVEVSGIDFHALRGWLVRLGSKTFTFNDVPNILVLGIFGVSPGKVHPEAAMVTVDFVGADDIVHQVGAASALVAVPIDPQISSGNLLQELLVALTRNPLHRVIASNWPGFSWKIVLGLLSSVGVSFNMWLVGFLHRSVNVLGANRREVTGCALDAEQSL